MATGRPRTYKPEFAKQAKKIAKLGATDQEIADFFEVSVRTIYRWKLDFPAFCQALSLGKEVPDDRVQRALYQRAVGYTFESEKIMTVGGQVKRVKILEHVPPDVKAGLAWLYNRSPGAWKMQPDGKTPDDLPPPASVTINVVNAHMSQDEIEAAAEREQAGSDANS